MVAVPIDVPAAPAAPAVEAGSGQVAGPPWGESALQQRLGQDYANWFHSAVHWVSGLFSSAGHAIDAEITQFLDDVVSPATQALGTAIGYAQDQATALFTITGEQYAAISAIITQLQYVAGQAGSVPGWVASQFADLYAFAAWVRGPLRSFLQSQIDNALAHAVDGQIWAKINNPAAIADALAHALDAQTWAKVNDPAAIAATGAQAIAHADAAAAGAAAGALSSAIAHADAIGAKVGAEVGALAGAVPGIAEHIAHVVSSADVAPIAAALAATIPAVETLTADAESCYNPMCDNLGGLTKLFGALKDDAWLLALVALLVEAATDPGAAVGTIDAIASDVEGIASGVADLLGVGR